MSSPRIPKKEKNVVAIVLVCVAIALGVVALGSCGFVGLILVYASSHNPPHRHGDDDAAPPVIAFFDDASSATSMGDGGSGSLLMDASSTSNANANANASSSSNAAAFPPHDFEDLFLYGGKKPGPPTGDVSLLTTHPDFGGYSNGRFGFSLEVPEAFTMMPAPQNDDGRQWRLGTRIAMAASGMHWVLPELPISCASGPNVTAHKETADSCFATGKRAGFIHWERSVVKNEVLFSLRFQYEESLKEQMDPIVTRVNRTWKF